MKKKQLILIVLTLCCFTFNLYAQKNEKPNIILVLVDDLGYSDIGSYGSEIQTPNIDNLAKEGLRLQQFYNNSICAPTRASLLTGQYASTAGMGYFDVNLGLPAYQGFLNRQSLTLAEVLKTAGYSTYLSGKWNVGKDSTAGQFPTQRGFDKFFGFLGGASSYLYPKNVQSGVVPGPFFEGTQPVSFSSDSAFYLTDVITQHAIDDINDASKKSNPFFLYLAYNAPHWPLQAHSEDVAKYKGKYDIGWDSLRKKRIERQIELGIIPKNTTASVKDSDIPDWNNLTYEEQHLWAKKMEIYAAMVDRVDQGIGQITKELKKINRDNNTLIIFISDNGAPAEDVSHFGGRVVNSGPLGTAGSYESQGKNWSYVSNTPFKEFKAFAYEGGISSPFIAWFPGKIKSGNILKGDAHVIDIAPTLYAFAQATYPHEYKGNIVHELPGKSLKQLLLNETPLEQRPLFWERAGNRAVQLGSWKLLSIYPSYEWQLYNIDEDRGETKNETALHPEIVNRLSALYSDWADKNSIVDFGKIQPKRPLLPSLDGNGKPQIY